MVVVVVIGVAAGGWELYQNHKASALCGEFRANAAAAPTTAADGDTSAVIIGDSYTSGFDLADPGTSWAYQLAALEHWRASVEGFPGSGFTDPTTCGGELYAGRVTTIPQGTMVAVIEGGLNDTDDLADLPRMAKSAITAATGRAGKVFVVGPPLAPVQPDADVRQADRDLAAVSRHVGAVYISTLGWKLPYGPDGLHLTEAGHVQFARQVAAAISTAS